MAITPVPILGEQTAFSEALRGLGEHPGERLRMREVVEAFGDRAFGAVMLVLGLISALPLPPGASTLTGAPLVLLSLQLLLEREHLWLPRRMMEASLPRAGFRKAIAKTAGGIRAIEKLSKPRLFWLVSPLAQRLIGLVCLLLAIELTLPIPLGNMAPGAAIAFFALGITQRDGAAVLVGMAGTGFCAGLLVVSWKLVKLAVTHLIDQVQHLL